MDFTLSKEHEMARTLFREFAEKEVKPLAQEVDETEAVSYTHLDVYKRQASRFLNAISSLSAPYTRFRSFINALESL